MSDDIPEIEVNVPVRIGLHLPPAELRVVSTIRTFITCSQQTEHMRPRTLEAHCQSLDAILQGAGLVKTDSGDV